jgi:hypothetical protein
MTSQLESSDVRRFEIFRISSNFIYVKKFRNFEIISVSEKCAFSFKKFGPVPAFYIFPKNWIHTLANCCHKNQQVEAKSPLFLLHFLSKILLKF